MAVIEGNEVSWMGEDNDRNRFHLEKFRNMGHFSRPQPRHFGASWAFSRPYGWIRWLRGHLGIYGGNHWVGFWAPRGIHCLLIRVPCNRVNYFAIISRNTVQVIRQDTRSLSCLLFLSLYSHFLPTRGPDCAWMLGQELISNCPSSWASGYHSRVYCWVQNGSVWVLQVYPTGVLEQEFIVLKKLLIFSFSFLFKNCDLSAIRGDSLNIVYSRELHDFQILFSIKFWSSAEFWVTKSPNFRTFLLFLASTSKLFCNFFFNFRKIFFILKLDLLKKKNKFLKCTSELRKCNL